jgi:hypothetical protein
MLNTFGGAGLKKNVIKRLEIGRYEMVRDQASFEAVNNAKPKMAFKIDDSYYLKKLQ